MSLCARTAVSKQTTYVALKTPSRRWHGDMRDIIDQQHADSHLDKHPELHGHIIGQADAISLADCAFRGLLAS